MKKLLLIKLFLIIGLTNYSYTANISGLTKAKRDRLTKLTSIRVESNRENNLAFIEALGSGNIAQVKYLFPKVVQKYQLMHFIRQFAQDH